jgi:sortase (surface protein transpeptidase)
MRRFATALVLMLALVLVPALAGCSAAAPAGVRASDRGNHSDAGDAGRIQTPFSAAPTAPNSSVVVTHLAIPDIGVSTDIELLGLDPQGALIPPVDFNKAGWYRGGVLPGQIGPAIIAGHIDSVTAPAVFVKLSAVTAGMKILVTLSNDTTLTFVATKSETALKSQFPSSDVYGNVPTPQLRLITCGGTFNPKIGHYNENLVVFASIA